MNDHCMFFRKGSEKSPNKDMQTSVKRLRRLGPHRVKAAPSFYLKLFKTVCFNPHTGH